MTEKIVITQSEVFNNIKFAFLFPIESYQGNVEWKLTRDFWRHPGKDYLLCAERFVDKAMQVKQLPFTFDRSFKGVIQINNNKLGDEFYKLLTKQFDYSYDDVIPFTHTIAFSLVFLERRQYNYEVSEKLKLLCEVANNLQLDGISFSGYPLNPIVPGLLEGDLINSLIFNLQREAKTKKFKDALSTRKSEARKKYEKSLEYVDSLYVANTPIDSYRLFLYHSPSTHQPISLERSSLDFMRLLNAMNSDLEKNTIVGWWWKRDFMSEINYCYHLFIFYKRESVIGQQVVKEPYGAKWIQSTCSSGRYTFPAFFPEGNYYSHNDVYSKNQDHDSCYLIKQSIKRMFDVDVYMQLTSDPKVNHFGMGPLPKQLIQK